MNLYDDKEKSKSCLPNMVLLIWKLISSSLTTDPRADSEFILGDIKNYFDNIMMIYLTASIL